MSVALLGSNSVSLMTHDEKRACVQPSLPRPATWPRVPAMTGLKGNLRMSWGCGFSCELSGQVARDGYERPCESTAQEDRTIPGDTVAVP